MNQLFDEILNICDPNESQIKELRRLFDKYTISDIRKNEQKDTTEDTKGNDYGALQRPSFRDYEGD